MYPLSVFRNDLRSSLACATAGLWLVLALSACEVTRTPVTESSDCPAIACANGGTCMGSAEEFECECAPGFEGPTCTDDTDDCVAQPCLNDGVCNDVVAGFICDCAAGFEGTLCAQDTNECEPEPCLNGGACTDLVAGFSCTCAPGFEGQTCDVNTDECEAQPCLNGGACTDLVAGFSCTCAPGFEGQTCDVNTDECEAQPCLNGGACTDLVAGFSCTCAPGLEGQNCEIDTDDCAAGPCLNGGVCNDLVAGYSCACAPGFEGETCTDDTDECAEGPCLNGGVCTDLVPGFSCACAVGFAGKLCAKIDPCADQPCLNGGTCSPLDEGFVCECAAGDTGPTCDEDINECLAGLHNCEGDGVVCINIPGGWRCSCSGPPAPPCDPLAGCEPRACGFTCQADEPECDCGSYWNTFYQDAHCHDVDECKAGKLCDAGTTCVNTFGYSKCECEEECAAVSAICVGTDAGNSCVCPRNRQMVDGECVNVDDCGMGVCPSSDCQDGPTNYYCHNCPSATSFYPLSELFAALIDGGPPPLVFEIAPSGNFDWTFEQYLIAVDAPASAIETTETGWMTTPDWPSWSVEVRLDPLTDGQYAGLILGDSDPAVGLTVMNSADTLRIQHGDFTHEMVRHPDLNPSLPIHGHAGAPSGITRMTLDVDGNEVLIWQNDVLMFNVLLGAAPSSGLGLVVTGSGAHHTRFRHLRVTGLKHGCLALPLGGCAPDLQPPPPNDPCTEVVCDQYSGEWSVQDAAPGTSCPLLGGSALGACGNGICWGYGCHFDCLGWSICKDGVVTQYQHTPISCWNWQGSCPVEDVITCQKGCAEEGGTLDAAGGGYTLCLEHHPKEAGDPCQTAVDCLPTPAIELGWPLGVENVYLQCDKGAGLCVEAPPPVVTDWMQQCQLPTKDWTAPAGAYGAVSRPTDVCSQGWCLIYPDLEVPCIRQGCTKPCDFDWDCPPASTCKSFKNWGPGGSGYQRICQPAVNNVAKPTCPMPAQ